MVVSNDDKLITNFMLYFVENPNAQLQNLVNDIIKYCLDHNAEAEACDLLMEMDCINQIVDYVTENIHERVCLYLTRSVFFVVLSKCLIIVLYMLVCVICVTEQASLV